MQRNPIKIICFMLISLAFFPPKAFARYHNICFDCHIMHSSKSRTATVITYPLNYMNDVRICTITDEPRDNNAKAARESMKREKKTVKSKSTIIKGSCIKCHGAATAYKVTGLNGKVISPFVRHPSDVIMPKGGDYKDYRQILSSENSAADPIICLSCHLLHNRIYNKWDYNVIMVNDSGCLSCHAEQD